jgi:uncharacterized protein (TIGR02231 family)
MKQLLFIGLMFCLLKTTYGQQQLHLPAPPREITLYLTAAEVKSHVIAILKEGATTITLTGFPASMDPNSLQVALPQGVEMLSVISRDVAVDPSKLDKTIKLLWDSLENIHARQENIQNQVDAYQAEKETLKQNQHLGGTQINVSLIELNKAADFFRERTLKINTALTGLNRKLRTIQSAADTVKRQYEERLGTVSPTQKNVEIVVSTATSQKIDLVCRYLVDAAGWSAAYDLVATDVSKPVTLRYKAQLFNDTGIDWKDVIINLSTGEPSLNASRPQLTAWILNYASVANEGYLNYSNINRSVASNDSRETEEEIAVAELSTTFPIDKKQTVPSNGQPYWIDLTSTQLNATFEYLSIPKVEASAFLIAKVTGWEKLNLIDGNANVYFGNAYIGQSRIDTRAIADTLELSLGRDNQIIVSRAKLEDKGETKFIGTKRSESFRYEIIVRNNRHTPITVKIQDQVPVSQESDITVDAEETSGAAHDVLSGRLQWIKTIQPSQTLKLNHAFTVRYPKGKQVTIRKQRMIRTPRYRR